VEQPQLTNKVPQEHVHVTHVGWMYMALVFISFAAVVGTGLGVYYLQQGQIDSLTQSLGEKHAAATGKVKEVTPTIQGTKFDRKAVPFTFEYPSDWTAVLDKPLLEDSKLDAYNSYGALLYVPGTIDEEMPGGKSATKGAVLGVRATKTSFKVADDITKQKDFAKMHRDISKTTMASLPGLRYTWAWEGPQVMATTVLKDGWEYSVTLSQKGEVRNGGYVAAYEALVKSFKFK
jgi:hypothetical protein